MTITNIGLTEAKYLNIKISETNGLKILGSKKVYIGNIESDDFDNAEFKVFIDKEAGSIINLPIELNYKDAVNEEYTEQISLKLKAYTVKEAIKLGLIKKNNTGIYAGIVVGLVIIWFVYRKIKKRRRSKNKKEE